ncbi:MAG: preprotein translocase subunit SecE [Candidatus Blackburnbacteria bacterium RIFCSPHIGHO2_01_FULL_43_15b]|uniref:Protein translocase subunit SecE n=1 Tax=Candidatus Blackburnbacteria bacterium RIFCSPHIGHO2_01_FULL_43_15b TaxID=1797513 RepID=A0A1G1V1Q8_9BACT|nr:MAG: preprotein translocase subunit SecE [Candidatus Blackburnbacteria bacterium RIFCSPHIGHO2_01_FULL_43_15b]
MNPITFLTEVITELKKVVWPSRNQTIQATVLVIAISLIVGLYVGGLDYIFTTALNKLLFK